MKKIKQNTKEKQKVPMKKQTKIILLSAIGVLVLAFVIMIIFESKSGSIKILNNTDMNLEYVEVYFVDSEGPASDPTVFQDFEPGDDIFQKRDEVDLLGKEANLEIRFKFKDYDEEMFVDSGYFNDR
ncbi:MAG TPA: hypothetical protein VJZ06_10455, partial [Mobilitalea sp.]|nr:hypothetical protein [Mobilitalea sp.]